MSEEQTQTHTHKKKTFETFSFFQKHLSKRKFTGAASDTENRKSRTKSYLKAPSQKFILHLQEVALVRLRLERLVDDGKLQVVLDVLPTSVAVSGAGGGQGSWDTMGQSKLVKQLCVGHHCCLLSEIQHNGGGDSSNAGLNKKIHLSKKL